jgi:hypothetical protein
MDPRDSKPNPLSEYKPAELQAMSTDKMEMLSSKTNFNSLNRDQVKAITDDSKLSHAAAAGQGERFKNEFLSGLGKPPPSAGGGGSGSGDAYTDQAAKLAQAAAAAEKPPPAVQVRMSNPDKL